ncbi:MAG: SDR family NAD(P)-dependent oxidoreductase [Bacteroidota bacterium]
MNDFTDKVVVITGAASGIGKALAIAFAKQGAQLALNDVNEEALGNLSAVLTTQGVSVFSMAFSVAESKAVHKFSAQVINHYGKVDLVINNAGVALDAISIEELEYTDLEWIMGINFYGVVYGTQAFLPYLKRREEAAIVNVSSVYGIIGPGLQAPYSSSKFAVRGFTECLRMELMVNAPHVRAICVHPGGIKTEIANSSRIPQNSPIKEAKRTAMRKEFNEKSLVLAPEKAAEIIIRGIRKKKHRILVGRDALFLDRLVRFFPSGYTRRILKLANIEQYWE